MRTPTSVEKHSRARKAELVRRVLAYGSVHNLLASRIVDHLRRAWEATGAPMKGETFTVSGLDLGRPCDVRRMVEDWPDGWVSEEVADFAGTVLARRLRVEPIAGGVQWRVTVL